MKIKIFINLFVTVILFMLTLNACDSTTESTTTPPATPESILANYCQFTGNVTFNPASPTLGTSFVIDAVMSPPDTSYACNVKFQFFKLDPGAGNPIFWWKSGSLSYSANQITMYPSGGDNTGFSLDIVGEPAAAGNNTTGTYFLGAIEITNSLNGVRIDYIAWDPNAADAGVAIVTDVSGNYYVSVHGGTYEEDYTVNGVTTIIPVVSFPMQ